MDVNIVNPFVDATLNVLETMALTRVKAGKPYLKNDSLARGDVSGVIQRGRELSCGPEGCLQAAGPSA